MEWGGVRSCGWRVHLGSEAHGDDLVADDAHVEDLVRAALRVDDAAVRQHEIKADGTASGAGRRRRPPRWPGVVEAGGRDVLRELLEPVALRHPVRVWASSSGPGGSTPGVRPGEVPWESGPG